MAGLEHVISDEDGHTVAKLQLRLTEKEAELERTPLDGCAAPFWSRITVPQCQCSNFA